MTKSDTQIAVILEKISTLSENCRNYVTKLEFDLEVEPLKKIVYGTVTFILFAFLAALVSLIIRK